MQLDAILEVAIGLVFAWLVLSIGTMQVQDWISQLFSWRAKSLEQAILDMFRNEKPLVDQFYEHPFIKELCKFDKNGKLIKKPDYIPNEVFGQVAFEVLMNAGRPADAPPPAPGAMSFDMMAAEVDSAKKSVNPELARTMDRLFPGMGQPTDSGAVSFGLGETFHDIGQKAQEYRQNVEKWFDKVMNQSSNWYKENAKKWAFGIGLTLALIFNIDTINVANALWREPTLRDAIVAQASIAQPGVTTPTLGEVPEYLDALAMPVGWTTVPAEDDSACNTFITSEGRFALRSAGECRLLANVPKANDIWGWLTKLLGLIISGGAAMQGAPFWFDILKKLVNIRPQQKPQTSQSPS